MWQGAGQLKDMISGGKNTTSLSLALSLAPEMNSLKYCPTFPAACGFIHPLCLIQFEALISDSYNMGHLVSDADMADFFFFYLFDNVYYLSV